MNSESDPEAEPYYPSCKLWRGGDPDDADSQAAQELGQILSGERRALLCLSGDIEKPLLGQPFADSIAPADWLLSEPALVSRYHELYRLSGAACALTFTERCAPLDLEQQGLAGASEAATRAAVRAAFSAGPLFVMGYMGPQPLPDRFDPNYEEAAYASWLELVKVFNVTGVHGVLISDVSVREAEIALRAAKSLLTIPVAVAIKVDPESLVKKDGFVHPQDTEGIYLDEAYERLAKLGADALGISGLLPKQAESIADTIHELAYRFGSAPILRLSYNSACDNHEEFDIPVLRLCAKGCRVFGLGKGAPVSETGRLADDVSQFAQAVGIEFLQ